MDSDKVGRFLRHGVYQKNQNNNLKKQYNSLLTAARTVKITHCDFQTKTNIKQ